MYLFLYAHKIDETDSFAKLTEKNQALKSTVVSIFGVQSAPAITSSTTSSRTNVKISALFRKNF